MDGQEMPQDSLVKKDIKKELENYIIGKHNLELELLKINGVIDALKSKSE